METILRGMSACDGIRTTPWGTVLATEETDDGGAYELLSPLGTTNYTVKDRATGEIVNASGAADTDEIVKRTTLPMIADAPLARRKGSSVRRRSRSKNHASVVDANAT